MNIKTKFSPEETAYYIVNETVTKIEIKSMEIKHQGKLNIKYISKDNEEYIEKSLLTKRELIELLNTNGY